MKRLMVAVLLCCIPVLAIAGDDNGAVPIGASDGLDSAFVEAFTSLDAAAVAKLYADDAVMGEPGMDKPVKGRKAIEEHLAKIFAGLSGVDFESSSADYTKAGDVVLAVGYTIVVMTMPDGTTVKQRADYADVRKQNSKGEWQFVQDFVTFTPIDEGK